MLSYRVILDIPFQLVVFVSELLAGHRREIGTRNGTRALTCWTQAVFTIAWFRDRPDIRRLGAGVRDLAGHRVPVQGRGRRGARGEGAQAIEAVDAAMARYGRGVSHARFGKGSKLHRRCSYCSRRSCKGFPMTRVRLPYT